MAIIIAILEFFLFNNKAQENAIICCVYYLPNKAPYENMVSPISVAKPVIINPEHTMIVPVMTAVRTVKNFSPIDSVKKAEMMNIEDWSLL